MRVLLWFCVQLFSFRCRSVGCKTSWGLLRKRRQNLRTILHLAMTGRRKNVIFRQGNQTSRPQIICFVAFRHKDIFYTHLDIIAGIATNTFSTINFIPTIFGARLIRKIRRFTKRTIRLPIPERFTHYLANGVGLKNKHVRNCRSILMNCTRN